MLHPPTPSPERILVFGHAGTGKTTNWLNIAKWSVTTKSDAKFYVLDTDASVERMLVNYQSIIPNLTLYRCLDWPDYTKSLTMISKIIKKTDWLIVDFISSAWVAVQNYFTEQVFHQTMGNYFLQARKELEKGSKSLGALEGWTDWTVINAIYKAWINKLIFRSPCHIYCTAQAATLSSDKKPTETAQTRQLFLRYQIKPEGQKHLPYQFHTILITGYDPRTKQRTITTVKDRERVEQAGLKINNFAIDYLKGVGGWIL